MADSKIKDLTEKATGAATDEFVINDVAGGNADKKMGMDGIRITESQVSDLGSYITASSSDTLTNKSIDGDNNTITNLATGAEVTVAANSIDSDAYVDGSIDEVHLADNIVSLAKMAGGTDGNLITFDTNGDPAYVSTGTSSQVLTSNGAGAAPTFQDAAGGSGQTFARVVKKADETVNNSDTLQDDDELTVSLNANKTYGFMMVLIVESGTTPDIKYGFSIPTGASGERTGSGNWASTNAIGGDDIETSIALPTFSGVRLTPIIGRIIVGGTAGSVTLQWAQNTADMSDSKVLEGSWFVIWEETA